MDGLFFQLCWSIFTIFLYVTVKKIYKEYTKADLKYKPKVIIVEADYPSESNIDENEDKAKNESNKDMSKNKTVESDSDLIELVGDIPIDKPNAPISDLINFCIDKSKSDPIGKYPEKPVKKMSEKLVSLINNYPTNDMGGKSNKIWQEIVKELKNPSTSERLNEMNSDFFTKVFNTVTDDNAAAADEVSTVESKDEELLEKVEKSENKLTKTNNIKSDLYQISEEAIKNELKKNELTNKINDNLTNIFGGSGSVQNFGDIMSNMMTNLFDNLKVIEKNNGVTTSDVVISNLTKDKGDINELILADKDMTDIRSEMDSIFSDDNLTELEKEMESLKQDG